MIVMIVLDFIGVVCCEFCFVCGVFRCWFLFIWLNVFVFFAGLCCFVLLDWLLF